MSKRIILLVMIGIVALGTMVLARSLLEDEKNPKKPTHKIVEEARTQIATAAKNIKSGRLLKIEDISWQAYPDDQPTDGLIVKPKDGSSEYIGAVVREPVTAGNRIKTTMLLKAGEGGFLPAVLEPGMRAITVKINPVSGVAGLIYPDDRVDVLLIHQVTRSDDANETNRRASETVLENVRVLALDQKLEASTKKDSADKDSKKKLKTAEVVTLEVTSKQAERLSLVTELGSLMLVLRSIVNDAEVTKEQKQESDLHDLPTPDALAASMNDLLYSTPHEKNITWDSDVSNALPPVKNKGETTHKIQILRGNATSQVEFDMRPTSGVVQ